MSLLQIFLYLIDLQEQRKSLTSDLAIPVEQLGVCALFWPWYGTDGLWSETKISLCCFICKVMLLLKVLVKVGKDYLIYQYVFIYRSY